MGNWIIKSSNTERELTAPDTHLYRVRKAEKLRQFINKNDLCQFFALPRKYIFSHEDTYVVVSEKLDLSNEVVRPVDQEIEETLKQAGWLGLGDQLAALANGASQRSLLPLQAKFLAQMACLGYTDLTYNNLYFTKRGQVAIVDTEPLKRGLKKAVYSSFFVKIFGDKEAFKIADSLTGTAKLKLLCRNPQALKEVEHVEADLILKPLLTRIAKLALTCLALY